jgi:hypothetical protein
MNVVIDLRFPPIRNVSLYLSGKIFAGVHDGADLTQVSLSHNYSSSSSASSETPMVPFGASRNTGPKVAPLSLLTLITGVVLV